MSIKKLLKEGVTYNTLKKIFEDCCSFLDFYETMKTYGIERKVSKVMALHFSGQGLQNQGARALSRPHEEKPSQLSSEHQENVKALQPDHPTHKPQSKMSATNNPPDPKSSNQAEAGEDWENEVATAAPRTDFTLKCTTPTPLSMDVEDISSTQWLKTTGSESSKGKPQTTTAHSEKLDGRNCEVTSKRVQGKARKPDVRDRSSNSTSNAPKRFGERGGKFKRQFKESKEEIKMKKEPISSRKGNKNEAGKKTPLKSRDNSEEHLDEKNSEATAGSVSSAGIRPKVEPRELPCNENSSAGECPSEKSRLPATPDLHGDSSVVVDVIHQFTSVFIGDIAILVPVENGIDADCNVTALNKSESCGQDQKEDTANTKCGKVADNSCLCQSPQESLDKRDEHEADTMITKPDKMVENLQPNQESAAGNVVVPVVSTSSQSECGTSYRPAQDLAEVPVTEISKVMDIAPRSPESSEGKAMMCGKLASDCLSEPGSLSARVPETCGPYQFEEATVTSPLNLEQSPGSATISDLLVSGDRAQGTNDSNDVNENESRCNDLTVDFLDETEHRDETLLSNGQNPACSVKNNSCQGETAIGVGIPWEELQLMPCASLPDEMSLASSDPVNQPMYRSFLMNQGLASHFITTEDVNHASRDLQAELSSESSSTSGEQPVDLFSRQPPLGAERGYTPDAVHHQPSWLGNTNDGICQMSPAPGFSNYNQTFPTLTNPYGTFHQAQQALPLLKPCYPSFAYLNHARPMIPPHVMHPPQQVFMPPFQYRNQVMFSNMAPAGVGFPPLPPAQLQPQMYPFLPVNGAYSSPPMSFCGNPYEQSPQSLVGATVNVNNAGLAYPANALPQVGPTVDDYRSLAVVSNGSQLSDEREESSSELSSNESSLDLMPVPAASQMYGNSTLAHESFPVQTENNSGFSTSLTYEDKQSGTIEDQNRKASWSENVSEYKNDGQVFNLAHLCYKEIPGDEVYVSKLKDNSCMNNSKELSSHQLSEGQEDPVHKQITILSREESDMAMGKRLSPDGSSMDGVCFDLPSDVSSAQNLEKMSEVKSSSALHRSEEHCNYRPRDMKEKGKERRKDKTLSPKPQRARGNRSRRKKSRQESSVTVSSQEDLHQPATRPPNESVISHTRPDVQSISSENSFESLDSNHVSNSCEQSQPKNRRRVRFSKEDVERQSLETIKTCSNPRRANASIPGQEKEKMGITSVEEISRLSYNGNRNMNDLEGSQTRSVNRSSTTSTKVEGERVDYEESRYKDRPQKHAEKRMNSEMRPANIKTGNFRKRSFNDKGKRPYKEKQPVKVLSQVKKPEANTRTDKNNNSK